MAFTPQGFTQKLRNLRESFGNTLGDVSNATGIGTQALQALETGSATPTGDEVLIIADFFKQDFSWFIDNQAANPDENTTLLLRSEGGRLAAADCHAIAEFLHLCKSQTLLEELLEVRPAITEFQFTVRGTFFKGQGIDCARAFREWHMVGWLIYQDHLSDGDIPTIIADNATLNTHYGQLGEHIQKCYKHAMGLRLCDWNVRAAHGLSRVASVLHGIAGTSCNAL